MKKKIGEWVSTHLQNILAGTPLIPTGTPMTLAQVWFQKLSRSPEFMTPSLLPRASPLSALGICVKETIPESRRGFRDQQNPGCLGEGRIRSRSDGEIAKSKSEERRQMVVILKLPSRWTLLWGSQQEEGRTVTVLGSHGMARPCACARMLSL